MEYFASSDSDLCRKKAAHILSPNEFFVKFFMTNLNERKNGEPTDYGSVTSLQGELSTQDIYFG